MSLDFDITHAVFQISPIGMAFISASSGVVLSVNAAYCSLLSREEAQLLGRTWMSFTHPNDIIRDFYVLRSLNDKETTHIQRLKRYLLPDGTSFYAHVTITPVQPFCESPIFLVSVETRDSLTDYKQEIISHIKQKKKYRDEVIDSLTLMANFHDRETGGHLLRTSLYVKLILEANRSNHPFSDYGIAVISKVSILHDIGKIGIPDSILHKKRFLSSEEFETMKTHTSLGALALTETILHLPRDSAFIYARDIAEFHHERWDGTGYPHGLAGEDIPYVARVMAIADVYDALRSERPYKESFDHVKSLEIIFKESGTHFDPDLCEVLFCVHKNMCAISESITDSSSPFIHNVGSAKTQ